MASSMDNSDSEVVKRKREKVKCLVHFETCSGQITYFKEKSWKTFLDYTSKWADFDCKQGDIARHFLSERQVSRDGITELPLVENSGDGYHR